MRTGEALYTACEAASVTPRRDLRTWQVSRVRRAIVDSVTDNNLVRALEGALALTGDELRAIRDIESTAIILSHFYADTRNDAGHPKPIRPARPVLYAYLKAFPDYAKRIGQVIVALERGR